MLIQAVGGWIVVERLSNRREKNTASSTAGLLPCFVSKSFFLKRRVQRLSPQSAVEGEEGAKEKFPYSHSTRLLSDISFDTLFSPAFSVPQQQRHLLLQQKAGQLQRFGEKFFLTCRVSLPTRAFLSFATEESLAFCRWLSTALLVWSPLHAVRQRFYFFFNFFPSSLSRNILSLRLTEERATGFLQFCGLFHEEARPRASERLAFATVLAWPYVSGRQSHASNLQVLRHCQLFTPTELWDRTRLAWLTTQTAKSLRRNQLELCNSTLKTPIHARRKIFREFCFADRN